VTMSVVGKKRSSLFARVAPLYNWVRYRWIRHRYPYQHDDEPPRSLTDLQKLRRSLRNLHDEWRVGQEPATQVTPGYKAGLLAFGHMYYLIDELIKARAGRAIELLEDDFERAERDAKKRV